MTEALVIQRDTSPGDALIALPVIEELAKQYDRLKVSMANERIAEIAEFAPNVERVRVDPNDSMAHENLKVLNLQIMPPNLHPTQVLLKQAGLPYHVLPRPKVKVQTPPYALGEFAFDVIFSPWARSFNRSFTREQAQKIVEHLKPLRVAIIQGRNDPAIDAPTAIDYPFAEVAGVMKSARCVLTTDSFPNRLAWAIGHPNHVLAFMNATTLEWATHPNIAHVFHLCKANENDRISPFCLDEIAKVCHRLVC